MRSRRRRGKGAIGVTRCWIYIDCVLKLIFQYYNVSICFLKIYSGGCGELRIRKIALFDALLYLITLS